MVPVLSPSILGGARKWKSGEKCSGFSKGKREPTGSAVEGRLR